MQEIVAAEAARAERAEARKQREQQLQEASERLEQAYADERQKVTSDYDGRRQKREEKLKRLLEEYRPDVTAAGQAVLEGGQDVVVAAKKGFLARLKQAAAMFVSL